MDTTGEVDQTLSAIRRQYWMDMALSLGVIAFFAWLASGGQYASKSIYSCLMLLNTVYLSTQLRLARRVVLLSQEVTLRTTALQANPPQPERPS